MSLGDNIGLCFLVALPAPCRRVKHCPKNLCLAAGSHSPAIPSVCGSPDVSASPALALLLFALCRHPAKSPLWCCTGLSQLRRCFKMLMTPPTPTGVLQIWGAELAQEAGMLIFLHRKKGENESRPVYGNPHKPKQKMLGT